MGIGAGQPLSQLKDVQHVSAVKNAELKMALSHGYKDKMAALKKDETARKLRNETIIIGVIVAAIIIIGMTALILLT